MINKKYRLGLGLVFLSFSAFSSCPDVTTYCYSYELDKISPIPKSTIHFQTGSKWDWKSLACKPIQSKNQFLQECWRRNPNLHAMVYPTGSFPVAPKMDYENINWSGVSTANWMMTLKNRYPRFSNAAIKDIVLPGTHDSGTYKIDEKSSYSPDEPYGPDFIKWLKQLDFAQLIYARWAKTQPYSIRRQLDNGFRYFDLRICGKNHVPYICHGKYSEKFSNIIQQINDFVQKPENKNEIILLDLNHFYEMNTTDHDMLISELIHRLGARLADSDHYSPDTPLKEFWHDGKQIIVFYSNRNAVKKYPELWSSHSIWSPWPNKQSVGDLIEALNNNLETHTPDDGFYVIQTQVTVDAKFVIDTIYKLYLPQSIHDNVLNYKQKIYDWLYSNKKAIAQYGGIIIEDWSYGKALTHFAITANGEKYWP